MHHTCSSNNHSSFHGSSKAVSSSKPVSFSIVSGSSLRLVSSCRNAGSSRICGCTPEPVATIGAMIVQQLLLLLLCSYYSSSFSFCCVAQSLVRFRFLFVCVCESILPNTQELFRSVVPRLIPQYKALGDPLARSRRNEAKRTTAGGIRFRFTGCVSLVSVAPDIRMLSLQRGVSNSSRSHPRRRLLAVHTPRIET